MICQALLVTMYLFVVDAKKYFNKTIFFNFHNDGHETTSADIRLHIDVGSKYHQQLVTKTFW